MPGTSEIADTVIGRSSVSSDVDFLGIPSNAVSGGNVSYGVNRSIGPPTPGRQRAGSFSISFSASFSGGYVA